jgi:hypothetical protein
VDIMPPYLVPNNYIMAFFGT